ncbi:hypothetical protein HEQ60_03015 [Haematospirillum sp. H1815]|uniref:hypothetical protein n=1 Tax=Haematospirillum sp. H1815 TaxID=2723108 RepID=UPI00143AFB25|nr:hypothetical protein [Haematospirillum sp. H1815]NKD76739.1 hypothetical protein [Haematospirillum sp. H1815]
MTASVEHSGAAGLNAEGDVARDKRPVLMEGTRDLSNQDQPIFVQIKGFGIVSPIIVGGERIGSIGYDKSVIGGSSRDRIDFSFDDSVSYAASQPGYVQDPERLTSLLLNWGHAGPQ